MAKQGLDLNKQRGGVAKAFRMFLEPRLDLVLRDTGETRQVFEANSGEGTYAVRPATKAANSRFGSAPRPRALCSVRLSKVGSRRR